MIGTAGASRGVDADGIDRRLGRRLVLTRLHARYGKDITNDLELKEAPPIIGGRELYVDPANPGEASALEEGDGPGRSVLEEGARPATYNSFQGRYAIRHEWSGSMECKNPIRGRWGGPPDGLDNPATQPALGLAFAARGTIKLDAMLKQNVSELGIRGGTLTGLVPPLPPSSTPAVPEDPPSSPSAAQPATGCGCGTTNHGSAWLVLAVVALLRRTNGRSRRRATS